MKFNAESLIETGSSAGSCESYIVQSPHNSGVECKYEMNTYEHAHGNWINPSNSSQVIFRHEIPAASKGAWLHSKTGKLDENNKLLLYSAATNEINSTNTACPPTDTMWSDGYNKISVVCKSSCPEFNDVKECQDAKCDPVATCTDTTVGFICKCPSTHYGNGITCTKIIIEDECSNGSHDCPQVCHDQTLGFSCSCRDDQLDVNGDERGCIDFGATKCCETFRIGVDGRNDRKLLCSYRRASSKTGMMDYTCEPNREFCETNQQKTKEYCEDS